MTEWVVRQRRRRGEESGFTLIELLVVIAILGILAAVVIFAVRGVGDKGKSSACAADRTTLENALEVHHAENRFYPASDTTPAGVADPPSTYDPSGAHETALVDAGFLSESSAYHFVTNDVIVPTFPFQPTTYRNSIRVQDPACGVLRSIVVSVQCTGPCEVPA